MSQWEAGTLGALKLRGHSKDGGEHGHALVGGAGRALLLCNFVVKQQK